MKSFSPFCFLSLQSVKKILFFSKIFLKNEVRAYDIGNRGLFAGLFEERKAPRS